MRSPPATPRPLATRCAATSRARSTATASSAPSKRKRPEKINGDGPHFSHLKILLTHSPEALELYYGQRALAHLRRVGDVKLHHGPLPLEGEALIRAAEDCDLIVSYRQSPAPAELFQRLPKLIAFTRC